MRRKKEFFSEPDEDRALHTPARAKFETWYCKEYWDFNVQKPCPVVFNGVAYSHLSVQLAWAAYQQGLYNPPPMTREYGKSYAVPAAAVIGDCRGDVPKDKADVGCSALRVAAQKVVNSWENGDLAAAVRGLDATLSAPLGASIKGVEFITHGESEPEQPAHLALYTTWRDAKEAARLASVDGVKTAYVVSVGIGFAVVEHEDLWSVNPEWLLGEGYAAEFKEGEEQ